MIFDTETTIYIVLEVLIGFVSVIGNALVAYVILQNQAFRGKVCQKQYGYIGLYLSKAFYCCF